VSTYGDLKDLTIGDRVRFVDELTDTGVTVPVGSIMRVTDNQLLLPGE